MKKKLMTIMLALMLAFSSMNIESAYAAGTNDMNDGNSAEMVLISTAFSLFIVFVTGVVYCYVLDEDTARDLPVIPSVLKNGCHNWQFNTEKEIEE